MDISFEIQPSEKATRNGLLQYYCYVYGPRKASFVIISAAFAVWGYFSGLSDYVVGIFLFWSLWSLLWLFASFLFYWRTMRNAFRLCGLFENTAYWRLLDTKYELRQGESILVNEYKMFTHYFSYRNTLFLLQGERFGTAIGLEHFPDGGTEMISCIRNCGVKPYRIRSLRNWRSVILFSIVAVLLFKHYGTCSVIAENPEFSYMPKTELVQILQNSPSMTELETRLGQPKAKVPAEEGGEYAVWGWFKNEKEIIYTITIDFDQNGKIISARTGFADKDEYVVEDIPIPAADGATEAKKIRVYFRSEKFSNDFVVHFSDLSLLMRLIYS